MNYKDTKIPFHMIDYSQKLKAICENLDHVLTVCAKEDRIDDIRKAANQYEL